MQCNKEGLCDECLSNTRFAMQNKQSFVMLDFIERYTNDCYLATVSTIFESKKLPLLQVVNLHRREYFIYIFKYRLKLWGFKRCSSA